MRDTDCPGAEGVQWTSHLGSVGFWNFLVDSLCASRVRALVHHFTLRLAISRGR